MKVEERNEHPPGLVILMRINRVWSDEQKYNVILNTSLKHTQGNINNNGAAKLSADIVEPYLRRAILQQLADRKHRRDFRSESIDKICNRKRGFDYKQMVQTLIR